MRGPRLHYKFGLELTCYCTWRQVERLKEPTWRRAFPEQPSRPSAQSRYYTRENLEEAFTEHLRDWCRARNLQPVSLAQADVSPNCEVEVHCPPLSRLNDVLAYYAEVDRIRRVLGWRFNKPRDISGGGHVHVSRAHGAWKLDTVRAILIDFTNRPYLNWWFNDPNDNDNAGSWLRHSFHDAGGPEWYWTDALGHGDFGGAKRVGLHMGFVDFGERTLEMRVFDMPRTAHEQRLHLLFLDRYLWWIERRWHKGKHAKKLISTKEEWLDTWTFEQSKREFVALLKTIGLDPRPYCRAFLINLRTRFRPGFERD